MNNLEQETIYTIMEKYRALITIISGTEERLRLSEVVFLTLNIIGLLFAIAFVSYLVHKVNYVFSYIDYALVFLNLLIGLSINVYWIVFAMRIQLKLKLRYFQARSIERRLQFPEVNIFSDEHIFFDPNIRRLESYDEKEVLTYPMKGLTRMDGFIGSLKPWHFSWVLPFMFIVINWTIFVLIATTIK